MMKKIYSQHTILYDSNDFAWQPCYVLLPSNDMQKTMLNDILTQVLRHFCLTYHWLPINWLVKITQVSAKHHVAISNPRFALQEGSLMQVVHRMLDHYACHYQLQCDYGKLVLALQKANNWYNITFYVVTAKQVASLQNTSQQAEFCQKHFALKCPNEFYTNVHTIQLAN